MKLNKSFILFIFIFSFTTSCAKKNTSYNIDKEGKIIIIDKGSEFKKRRPLSSNKEMDFVLNKIENENETASIIEEKNEIIDPDRQNETTREDQYDTIKTLKDNKELEYSNNSAGIEYNKQYSPAKKYFKPSDESSEMQNTTQIPNYKLNTEVKQNNTEKYQTKNILSETKKLEVKSNHSLKNNTKIIRLGIFSNYQSGIKAKNEILKKYKSNQLILEKYNDKYILYIGPFDSKNDIEKELNVLVTKKIYDFEVERKKF